MIAEVELFNWCQHRHFHATFGPGLTAIIGSNGSGKSNVCNGIAWLWTGDYLVEGDKEANICDLAGPKEHVYGRLVLIVAGHRIEVVRYIRPGRKATISIDGVKDKEAEGDKRVTQKLAELLQTDPRLVPKYIFAQQLDILGFLSEEPAVRARTFQQLFNTSVATVCSEAIGKHSGGIVVPEVAGRIQTTQQNLATAEQELLAAEQALATFADVANLMQSQAADAQVIAHWDRKKFAQEQLRQAEQQNAATKQLIAAATSRLTSLQANEKTIAEYVNGNKAKAEQAQQALSNFARWKTVRDLKTSLEQQIAAAKAALESMPTPQVGPEPVKQVIPAPAGPPEIPRPQPIPRPVPTVLQLPQAPTPEPMPNPPEKHYKQVEMTWQKYHEYLTYHWQTAQTLLEAFENGAAVCPTCQTPATSEALAARIAEARNNLPEITRLRDEVAGYIEACVQVSARNTQAVQRWESTCQQMRQKHDSDVTLAETRWQQETQAAEQLYQQQVQAAAAAAATAAANYQQQVQAAEAAYDAAVAARQEAYLQAVSSYNALRNTRTLTLTSLQQQYDGLQLEAMPTGDEAELTKVKSTYDEFVTTLTDVRTAIAEATNQINGYNSEISGRMAGLSAAQADAALPVTEADATAARQRLETLQQRQDARNQALVVKTQKETTVGHLRQMLQTLSNEAAEVNWTREWFAHAQNVQDLLKAAARFVSQRNLQALELQMNDLLAQCGVDYRVKANEELTFSADFFDGRKQPAGRFSGGQKTLLVLLFRILVNSQFAGGAGTMILDEPTAWLDKERIAAFEPLLARVQQIIAQRNLQVIFVTHEEELARLCPGVVRVGSR